MQTLCKPSTLIDAFSVQPVDDSLVTCVQVSVKCGSTEKLLQVEEPSRCEYVAMLLTPAACTPTELQAIEDKLSALDKELEDDHDEL